MRERIFSQFISANRRNSLKISTFFWAVIRLSEFRSVDLEASKKGFDVGARFRGKRRCATEDPQKLDARKDVAAARVDDGEGIVVGIQDPVFSPGLILGETNLQTTGDGRPRVLPSLSDGRSGRAIGQSLRVIDRHGIVRFQNVVSDAAGTALKGIRVFLQLVTVDPGSCR